ncbi:MAG: isochorismatase family protein [Pseudochelatococcus sp.]|jgi:maleamate amidohydrolase|uniref:isochorismatase family protein n=1 Tax=Pseudochelatococcus sp. TaxID=2020869 RepID=UPI003D934CC4
MSESDIYRKQGFGQTVEMKGPVALLIVDFVNGFADPAQFGGGNIPEAIRATVPVLDLFRRRKLPVAHTRIVFADDGSDATLFSRKVPSLLKLTETNPASAIVPELAPLAGELVVRKTQPSGFASTALTGWLAMRGVRSLVICGCVTSGCIRATVVDAMQGGILPIVPRDCVGDRAMGPHEANLFDIAQKYGNIIMSTEIERLLDQIGII